MACLQSLFLRDTPDPTNHATDQMAMLHAPLLQKLTICSPRPGFICLPIPWKQLTHLSFGNDHPGRSTNHTSRPVDGREMLKLLVAVPNLTFLVLSCLTLVENFEHIPSIHHIECIRLPKLVSLELHDPNFELLYSTPVDFLSRLYTPALEVFDLIFRATEASRGTFRHHPSLHQVLSQASPFVALNSGSLVYGDLARDGPRTPDYQRVVYIIGKRSS